MKANSIFIVFILLLVACGQKDVIEDDLALNKAFTSFRIGHSEDLKTQPDFGIVMMGGRSEHDQAMKWFLSRANKGDVLVLRASGSDGYNRYLFEELGVELNSVETLVINKEEAANDDYVIQRIQEAEAIWMAGGNQWDYINIWGNSKMKQALNQHINIKKGVIGGTSAGMAVLGEWYFSAEHGSLSSDEILSNPKNSKLKLGNDFLSIDILQNTITDTHFANRDRQGRLMVFMAEIMNKSNEDLTAIACDEYTAVCIDEKSQARVFGNAPNYDDAVYFISKSYSDSKLPERFMENQPFTWSVGQKALKVIKIAGDKTGNFALNLKALNEADPNLQYYWYVEEGVWNEIKISAKN